MTDEQAPPPFEASLERLETIVKEMESGDLSLEQMMAHFQEGTTLVKQCGKKLEEVEQTIEKLVKKGDEVVAETFHPEGDSGGQ
jgi:exodeoxyribonuclease VII small subunit